MARAVGNEFFGGVNIDDTTWDAIQAPHQYLQGLFPGETLQEHREKVYRPLLTGTPQRKEPILERTYWDGTLPTEIQFEQLHYFLKQLMGKHTHAQQAATTAYLWTFTPDTLPTLGLSIYMNRTTKLYKYSGGKVASATFKIGGGLPVCTADFELLGGTAVTDTVETRATAVAGNGFFTDVPAKRINANSAITVGGQTVKAYVEQATINIRNPLVHAYSIFGSTPINPQRETEMEVDGELVAWLEADVYTHMEADFENDTDSSIVITVENSTEAGVGYPYKLIFTFESVYFGPTGTPTGSSKGLIPVTFPFSGWYDETNDQAKIELYNKESVDVFA